MNASIQVGDIDTQLVIRVLDETGKSVGIGSAQTLLIKLRKPSGTVIQRSASIVGSPDDGAIGYRTVLGDIDEAGTWRIQALVEIAPGQWHTTISSFSVGANLS